MATGRRWSPRWLPSLRPAPPTPPPADDRRLPQFLIIGAQKAGTTWMHAMLGEHPDVFMPTPKELHFFDQRRNYDKGLDWYADHYREAPAGATLGEATPNYLWASDHLRRPWARKHFDAGWKHSIPERVRARLGGELPLLVMLREPVARAVSAFYHHVRVEGRMDPDATFARNAQTWGIAHMGFYAAHLERWYEVYPPEQLKVMIFEEVMQRPQQTVDEVCDHIGVQRVRLPEERLTERVHGGTKHTGEDGQYYYDEACSRLAISHDDLAMLGDLYAPENARLAQLLGRDLDVWGH